VSGTRSELRERSRGAGLCQAGSRLRSRAAAPRHAGASSRAQSRRPRKKGGAASLPRSKEADVRLSSLELFPGWRRQARGRRVTVAVGWQYSP